MFLKLDRAGGVNLARQIYLGIKAAILDDRLAAGEQLPSTRNLAESLAVARNTVTEAYELLKAEGYIHSSQGSGSRVTENLYLPPAKRESRPRIKVSEPSLIRYDFKTGLPLIPASLKNTVRLTANRVLDQIPDGELLYGHYQGRPELREEIAFWLYRNRGLKLSPDDIFISSGSNHALSMAMELLKTGTGRTRVAIEHPCHLGILRILEQKGLEPQPVEVDDLGIVVTGIETPDLAAAYVTPSHQFPLGGILSAQRRVELIKLARKNDFYIIEDDYDGEFRHSGQPISPLHSLDRARVIYLGTFSKCLYPAIRVGFAILPPIFREKWLHLRKYSDIQSPIIEQLLLAELLRTRKLDKHIRKTAKIYSARLAELKRSLKQNFGGRAVLLGDEAGIHLAVKFCGGDFDQNFQKICLENGLRLTPCSVYSLNGRHRDTLVLGYGGISREDIPPGVALIKKIIDCR